MPGTMTFQELNCLEMFIAQYEELMVSVVWCFGKFSFLSGLRLFWILGRWGISWIFTLGFLLHNYVVSQICVCISSVKLSVWYNLVHKLHFFPVYFHLQLLIYKININVRVLKCVYIFSYNDMKKCLRSLQEHG